MLTQDDLDAPVASRRTANVAATAATAITGIIPAIVPAADDVVASVLNTTAGWNKERVRPLSETLGEQTGVYVCLSVCHPLSILRSIDRLIESE